VKRKGYISRVKSNNSIYYYLRISYRFENQTLKKNIIAFGKREIALNKINNWLNNYHEFPSEFKEMGYSKDDLIRWKYEIENG
jgi:hypothetical protein